MKTEAMQNMPWEWMPTLALLIFFTIFVAVLAWSHRPGSKKLYEEVANNALSDGEAVKNENKGSNNE
ncbi:MULTISPECIES: cbb3-type cytochrome oxidase subunit 3 [Halobacteriovorax]|uniref:Cbb3-type cytochrome c oxidase subunit 3 n=1 Tax=Halobacteriovorax vibrionivorans TaxID=2152716 RepID=A0ABY0IEH8_9BACT|nr:MULTISPECIES: cbb3-type cytochrome c oxidase subunit 3 [Halobacteriovorax]RZF20900.1 cbb3-type cytochrome c oxidase subunit 3 [Halobacteriovorax vibrionivorans]TGD48090.1 cbb3-type cytochrome c oxidase subunit 3 [Halobacteriovorax sp. Y22]